MLKRENSKETATRGELNIALETT